MNPPIQVKYGLYHDIVGPARAFDGITFIPAATELHGNGFEFFGKLCDWARHRRIHASVRRAIDAEIEAAWVRGRIAALFGVTSPPEDERSEKSGSEFSFLAVIPQSDGAFLGVPFDCTDYYLRSQLMFSSAAAEPPLELRQRISDTFWQLLLNEPEEVADYEDRMYHLGGGFEMRFGVDGGQAFCEVVE